jgi:hypothetical protein
MATRTGIRVTSMARTRATRMPMRRTRVTITMTRARTRFGDHGYKNNTKTHNQLQ